MSIDRKTAKDPGLVFDVGLHHGQDTDFYLKKGYRVIAFEADPGNAEFCRERFAAEIAGGRLTIVEGAIAESFSSNGNGATVRFYRNVNHSLWGSTSEDWASRNEVLGTTNEIIKVPAIDFAAALAKYGIPHYLKADIVGSEGICLRALRGFDNRPDYISIRSEKLVFGRLEQEFDLLEQLGYERFKAVKQEFEKVRPQLPSSNGARYHTFEEGASGTFGEETRGPWKTRDEVVADYRRIFVKYWLFGDYSYLIQTQRGKQFIERLERVVRRSIPGWYDTHAVHSSVRGK
jgi:FkbM family methyltransferase